jgi:DNA-binding FadR family transcriptional regulator
MAFDPPALRRAEWVRGPTRAQSRPERAAEQLAAMAMACSPGDRLGTKDDLRAACGVSVGTFNEALRMAQARGLVTVRSGPGGGLFASHQSAMVRLGNSMLGLDEQATSVADAVRLRDALDPLVIRDAFDHASSRDIASLRNELGTMKLAAEAGASTAFWQADWSLRARIAEISPSGMLRFFYQHLLEISASALLESEWMQDQGSPQRITRLYELYVELIDAIAGQDLKVAESVCEQLTLGSMLAGESVSERIS